MNQKTKITDESAYTNLGIINMVHVFGLAFLLFFSARIFFNPEISVLSFSSLSIIIITSIVFYQVLKQIKKLKGIKKITYSERGIKWLFGGASWDIISDIRLEKKMGFFIICFFTNEKKEIKTTLSLNKEKAVISYQSIYNIWKLNTNT
ncbi:MAG: hypothetical protein NXI08_06305 [bacterium]|nr:hypothetical protein [bacterium]